MAEVISKDIAQDELNKWLDFKRKSQQKRDDNATAISAIVDAICEGDVVIMEDFSIVQNLRLPIEDKEGKAALSKLEYKPRIKAETIQIHCQGLKATDLDGRVNAHIAALTSNPKDLIKKLDYDDYAIASMIVTVFFS